MEKCIKKKTGPLKTSQEVKDVSQVIVSRDMGNRGLESANIVSCWGGR